MNELQQSNPRGTLTGVFIALFAAIISVVFYILFTYFAYKQHKTMVPAQQVIVQLTAVMVAIGITQFLFRQIQGNKLKFKQAFFGGWMSCMMLGIFVAFYYSIFAKQTGNPFPKAGFAMVLMLYNLLGIIISFIFALIFKKE